MEEFTRECLEVDRELNGDDRPKPGLLSGTSMEQIYERAARLVKRTLDVEGAIVMDVSHVDVLETVGAESLTSITIYSDDPQVGTETRMLNSDEYSLLQDFFNRSPDGKICEGVLPAGLRPFLPARIQYALCKGLSRDHHSWDCMLMLTLGLRSKLYRFSISTSDHSPFCVRIAPVSGLRPS